MRLATACLCLVLVGNAAGCGETTEPSGPPVPIIEGVITLIELDRPRVFQPPRVLIEEEPNYGTGVDILPELHGDKIWFSIGSSTRIRRELADGSIVAIGVEELVSGWTARAWHRGPVTDSYPQQTGARLILVTAPPNTAANN